MDAYWPVAFLVAAALVGCALAGLVRDQRERRRKEVRVSVIAHLRAGDADWNWPPRRYKGYEYKGRSADEVERNRRLQRRRFG